jgi:Ca-activated chloride channel homolog
MKKIILLVCSFLVVACEPQQNNPPVAESKQRAIASPLYAYSREYTWPTIEQSITLATNVLSTNYYLVIDGSGSMMESGCANGDLKINVAKRAIVEFVKAVPEDANVGLLTFDSSGIMEKVALGKDRSNVLKSIRDIDAGGGTPLKTAITQSYSSIQKQSQTQLGYGEYHMVVVTDGEANFGEDPKEIVYNILTDTPVQIHTIGFCIDAGHSLNIPGLTDYRSATNPKELSEGLSGVLAEAPEYDSTTFNQ